MNNLEKHTCHAEGCTTEIPPKLLMCPAHWRQVPKALQLDVLKHYRAGQEVDKTPSAEYLKAARNAINSLRNPEPNLTQALGGKNGRVEISVPPELRLPDWIAKRPRHLPLIAYHALNATLVEFKHPQTRIVPREDGNLYLHHVEMGSVELLSGYRLATLDDLSTAQFFLSAGGMCFDLSTDGTTVTLDHPDGIRKVRLPSAEDVEFEKVVRGFSRYFDGVIVADEEDAP